MGGFTSRGVFIALCVGESKAPPVLYPSYSMVYMRRTLTAGKMQSTINQLSCMGSNGTWDGLDRHTTLGYASCRMAISTTPIVPLLRIQH